MNCMECGKEISEKSRFCRFCGTKTSQRTHELDKSNNAGFKDIILNIFDIESKKNFWESLILYALIFFFGMSFHFLLGSLGILGDTNTLTYVTNGSISFLAILLFSNFRKIETTLTWILAIVGGVLGYLLSLFGGLLPLFYVLMKETNNEEDVLDKEEKQYLYGMLKSGFVWYLAGIIITLISLSTAEDGGSFTVFYGATIYGLFQMIKAMYYRANPEKLKHAIYRASAGGRGQQQHWISPGFKKFITYTVIIGVILIVLVVIFQ